MMPTRFLWWNYLRPHTHIVSWRERWVCAVGALLGLAVSSAVSRLVLGDFNAWYIAPMGASSVLLFAVSSSPLAQPWNVLVGNGLSAVVGVACFQWIPDPTLAFSVGVACAIFVMMTTGSLHPPGGAIAMTAVLGGSAVHQLGWYFVLYPVLLNSVLLLVCAMIYHRLLKRPYPQPLHVNTRSESPTALQKATIRPQDIREVLDEQTELLDISQYDLEQIILQAQQLAFKRMGTPTVCADMMTQDVVSLHDQDDIYQALGKFKSMNLMSLPVVNQENELVGTLALYEVVEWFKQHDNGVSWAKTVKEIMNRKVVTVEAEQPIYDLIPYFVEKSFNYIPVVDGKRLIGIISRSDMIAVLYRQVAQNRNNC